MRHIALILTTVAARTAFRPDLEPTQLPIQWVSGFPEDETAGE
jgi:hypothetical protein